MLVPDEANLVPNLRLPPILWEKFTKSEKILDGADCLRPLIRLMAQKYLKDLTDEQMELTDEQIE